MPASNNKLTIYILNVGQADTSVIITPKGNLIIIDAVSPPKLTDLLDNIGLSSGDKIDELIITHPHTDHYRGASRLLNDYQVMSVTLAPFWNQFGMGPPSYRNMVNKIEQEGCSIDFISGYGRIYPDGALDTSDPDNPVHDKDAVYVELLGPSNNMISQLERDDKLDTNHLSVMSRLNWKKFSMLFAADAQMENWSFFDQEGMLNKKCNILRTAHHGSGNGTQWERLYRLDPKCVFISSDPEIGHHLPDLIGSSVFAKFEVRNTTKVIALTKNTGSIRIEVTNGKKFEITHYKDAHNENIDFSKGEKLTWNNNPTQWKDMLYHNADDLYT